MEKNRRVYISFVIYITLCLYYIYDFFYLILSKGNLPSDWRGIYSLEIIIAIFMVGYTALYITYVILWLINKKKKITKRIAYMYIALSLLSVPCFFYSFFYCFLNVDGKVIFLIPLFFILDFCLGITVALIFCDRLIRYLKGEFPEFGVGSETMDDSKSYKYEHKNEDVPRKKKDPYSFNPSDVDPSDD